ncbi:MAG: sigma 54-interacting transcriptional regulator, partial [Deltaproteobacteria bacterium]|nr:sigma 54-interacting transcriptional regulator [Deltaproteobacteria bacterium]
MPELLISKNDLFLFRYPLSKTALKMGRGSQCDVILANDSISREQLLLYPFEGSFFLKNVGQAEITLNGKSIKSSPFQKGDVVQIHDFKIELNDQNDEDWSDAATLVTSARGESTQAIHASYLKGKIIQEALQLKIQEPDRPERSFSIMNEVSLIGKGPHCDLRLEDSFCSDQHGKLIVKNGKVTWLDLNSTNGSYVKGVQVREATLEEGMTLRIGKTDLSLVTQVEEKKVEALPLQSFGPIVGASPAMQQLYGLLQQVAPSDASVCVFGETGSGKELVARSLHELSPRKLKPLVTINCGAISRELIESELFGHEKGAFTGAHQQHKGVFEQAQGGTLFLD